MTLAMEALRAGRSGLVRLSSRTGLLSRVADSRWRRQRLLILGYHGIGIEDEHAWDPRLFVSRALFEQRLDLLASGGYAVLPLDDALARLASGTLPPRAVVMTFDDGMYNFHRQAYPLLAARNYPATVFLTTYYCEVNKPVFNLALSYLLWKTRVDRWTPPAAIGIGGEYELEKNRWPAWRALIQLADRTQLSAQEKDQLVYRVADSLEVDYDAIKRKRLLQIMNPDEVRDLAARGVDFQLHTHRHRTPRDPVLFDHELTDNSMRLERMTGVRPVHFCYPNGDYAPVLRDRLSRHGVRSATTCDPGLAAPNTPMLLLPRFLDATPVTPATFESWVSGAGTWLSRARSYAPGN